MKFKDFSEFRIYLEDKLLSKEVIRKHMNIYEDTREMTDIKKDEKKYLIQEVNQIKLYLVIIIHDYLPFVPLDHILSSIRANCLLQYCNRHINKHCNYRLNLNY